MPAKTKAKKPEKKPAKSKSPAGAKKALKAKAPAAKKTLAAKGKGKAAPEAKKPKKLSAAEEAAAKRKLQAKAAMDAAMDDGDESGEEEEFDPEAFFAASGGKGILRAHVMRKERVEFNLSVRYRFLTGPLVYSAELLNLSKGGLCLRTQQVVKAKTTLRIEIPLPHTSELFAVQAEVIWSGQVSGTGNDRPIHTGLRFLAMSLAKQTVINSFVQARRDQLIMAKIGLDKFGDSAPVAGLD